VSNIIKNYNKVVGEIGRLEIEIADLKKENERLKDFVMDMRDNYDHSEDAHKHKTICFVCIANDLLKQKD